MATVPGTRYIGTISYIGEFRRLRLVFAQEQSMGKVEATDPDRQGVKRSFAGELLSNPQSDKDGETYPIVLAPAGKGTSDGHFLWTHFYGNDSPLKLRLTEKGLEGKQGEYAIRLQRER